MPIEEKDLAAYLQQSIKSRSSLATEDQKCQNCGARVSYAAHKTHCSFCHGPLKTNPATEQIQPTALLPMVLDKEHALLAFRDWLKKRWFLPRDLTPKTLIIEDFEGLYLPFWCFDLATITDYRGMLGHQHTRTEFYTTTQNGQTTTHTRQVPETIWTPVKGTVAQEFQDQLIFASNSMLRKEINKLEPWNLNKLVAFEQDQMGGLSFEKYQIDVVRGFELVKHRISSSIDQAIRADIGGYQQMVKQKDTQFEEVTFKHILLPVYVCAYEFSGKTYRFVINAQTGEVQGQRPWSWLKIGLLVSAVAAGILALVLLATA